MFREDVVWHTFHAFLHITAAAVQKQKEFKRPWELFFYAHQQMVRKVFNLSIELAIAGKYLFALYTVQKS